MGVHSTLMIHFDKDIKTQIKSHQHETEEIEITEVMNIGWEAIPFYSFFIHIFLYNLYNIFHTLMIFFINP